MDLRLFALFLLMEILATPMDVVIISGVLQEDEYDDDAVRSANRTAFLSYQRLRFVWLVRKSGMHAPSSS